MPVNDTDKLLVNDGSKTETVTFAQFKEGSMLNNTDKFLINDGSKTETVTWADIQDELGPKGEVVKPTVLKPKDGAGSGEERPLQTNEIIAVEGGGIITCETELIESVETDSKNSSVPDVTLSSFTAVNTIQSSSVGGAICNIGGTLNPSTVTPAEFQEVLTDLKGNEYPGYLVTNFNNKRPGFEAKGSCGWLIQVNGGGSLNFNYTNGPGTVYIATGSQTGTTHSISGDTSTTSLSTSTKHDILAIELTAAIGSFSVSPNVKHDYFGVGILNPEDYGYGTTTLTFPSAKDFGCFEGGDVVQTRPNIDGFVPADSSSPTGFSNGNLTCTGQPAQLGAVTKEISISSGFKVYWEHTYTVKDGNEHWGVVTDKYSPADGYAGVPGTENGWSLQVNGVFHSGSAFEEQGTTFGITAANDIVGVALDTATGEAWLRKNGTWLADPATDPASIKLLDTVDISEFTAFRINLRCYGISVGNLLATPTYSIPDGYISAFSPSVKIVSIDDSDPYTIVVDGGAWKGSVSGESGDPADQEDKLVKETPYDTKLTLAGAKDLNVLQVGDVVKMGMDADVPYQPVSDSIVSVGAAPAPIKKIRVKRYAEGLGGAGNTQLNGLRFDGVVQTTYIPLTVRYTADGVSITEVSDENDPTMQNLFKAETGPSGTAFSVLAANSDHYIEIEFDEPQDVGKLEIIAARQLFSKINDGEWLEEVDPSIGNYEWHEVTQPNVAPLLTLSGPTDLAYFRKGDVVQGTKATVDSTSTQNYADPQNAFDGDDSTFAYIDQTLDAGTQSWLAFDIPDGTTEVKTLIKCVSGNNISLHMRTDPATQGTGTWTTEGTWSSDGARLDTRANTGPNVSTYYPAAGETKLYLWGNNSGIEVYSVTPDPNKIVKIISIDESVPSITVDGGEWDASNQSEFWSSLVTNPDGSAPTIISGSMSDGFDGSTSTLTYGNGSDTWRLDLSSIGLISKIEAYDTAPPQGRAWQAEGELVVQCNGTAGKQVIYNGSPKTINYVDVMKGLSGQPAWFAVYVNDKLLVDQGIGDLGDTEVTCVSPLKAPTDWKIEGIEGNTLSLSHATPDDNAQVWVANDNQAGTDFYVTGITIIDDPLLTTNVELESSQFATIPDGVDGLKEIIWNINDVDQSAGTNNPYRPIGLPLNSQVTIKVKHVANSIGESQWSDSTKFSTGASRTLKDHYMTRILELETALADAKPKRSRKKKED